MVIKLSPLQSLDGESTQGSSSSSIPTDDTNQHQSCCKGFVIGGIYLERFNEKTIAEWEGSHIIKMKVDVPLTMTHEKIVDGEQVILLDFAPDDIENPFNWSKARKAFISMLLCLMTLFIGLATTAYSSGITRMSHDLDVSIELGQLGLFTFNFACAVAPLFLAPFCELVGRRVVYAGAYACFVLVFLGLAFGKNIATILICRALSGLFGCVGTILAGGTFSDMYPSDERAIPMASFSYVAILGTVAAPMYSGFIAETIGWRWIEGIHGLSNLPLLGVIIVFFKETRGRHLLQKRAKAICKATGDNRYKSEMDLEIRSIKKMLYASSVKAVHMLVTEPVVFAFGLWISFAWFVTFLFLSVIPITFEEKRGWSEGIAGLPYISLCIGVTIAFGANFLQIRKYKSINAPADERVLPEFRLYGAMFGAIWLPIGLFLYSFTQYQSVSWIAPTISLAPIAVGIFFIFESCYSYTSDCYGESSSSAIAGQGFMRNTLGGVAPLFATQFFRNLGSQYAGLMLALVAAFLSLIPFVFFKYGHVLRQRSELTKAKKDSLR